MKFLLLNTQFKEYFKNTVKMTQVLNKKTTSQEAIQIPEEVF